MDELIDSIFKNDKGHSESLFSPAQNDHRCWLAVKLHSFNHNSDVYIDCNACPSEIEHFKAFAVFIAVTKAWSVEC